MDVIDTFRGEYRFLSNFYPCIISMQNVFYPSVEHAYQAAKTENLKLRIPFQNENLSPVEAKRKGKQLILREDWEFVKLFIMYKLVKQKFIYPTLKEKLLATNNAELIEGNYWHDYYWGICNGKGENWLGKILMHIRRELND